MTEVFCPLPWYHLATKANGDLRICCQSNQGPTRGILKNESGDTYNLNKHGIMDSRNAPLAKEVRAAMLNGIKHPECSRCWKEESSGIRSKRIGSIELHSMYDSYGEAIQVTQPDGTIPQDFPYRDYDLRFGNLCNLKCRMCGPTESSMWYDDYFEQHGKKFDDTGYRWHERPEIWRDLESQMEYSEYVYIIGGEPTLIQKHFEFLEKCIKNDHSKRMRLEYASNITNIHQKYFDIWSQFKKVHIACSIDGVGAVNDYIRFPSKWKVIEKNLEKLVAYSSKKIRITISLTVNAYNVYYLDDVYKWNLQNLECKINPHPLHGPRLMSTKIFPKYIKDDIAKKIRSLYQWMKNNGHGDKVENISRQIESHIHFMMSEDLSQLMPEFWKETDKLDAIRRQNISNSLPELYDLIKDTRNLLNIGDYNGIKEPSA